MLRTLLMMGGTVLFVSAQLPLTNPGKFALATNKEAPSFLYSIITLSLSVLLLSGAWLLNPKKEKPDQ